MRGLELMLVSLYTVMQNTTNYTDNQLAGIDGELDTVKFNTSLGMNSKNQDETKPIEIRITTWQNMPYSGYKKENGVWKGEGLAFDILHLIQKRLNFTYTLIFPENSILGDKDSGIMSLLHNHEVDLAVAFIPTMAHLTDFCTFSSVLDDIEITFLMKRPSESATGQGIFAPFNKTVWMCILISWIIFGPTMCILIFIRSKISSNSKSEKYSLPTCVWFTYGALLKQGTTTEPITNPTRLLFATWWIFIIILTSFYTANLTAFLTLSEFTLPFNSAKDIADKHQRWIAAKDYTVQNILGRKDSGTLEPLEKSVRRKEGSFIDTRDYSTILDSVTKGRIFVGDRRRITSIIVNDYQRKTREGIEETARCTYVMLPKNIYVMGRAFAFSKKWPVQRLFNQHLMHIVETGIVKHLKNRDIPSVNVCPLNLKSKERRLRNTDLTMTYKIMAVGFILSGLIFLGELIHKYFCHCKCCNPSNKITTPILPIHSIDPRPEYLKRDPLYDLENLYRQHKVGRNIINGREYWIITERDGDRRLVPIRSPSALLFHYTTK